MKLALAAAIFGAMAWSIVFAAPTPSDNTASILAAQGYYDVTAVPCASIPPGTPVSTYSGTVAAPIWTLPAGVTVLPVCRW